MDQQPSVGARCRVRPGGGDWEPATIRRVNEDGTFTVEPDVKAMIIMPLYHGVTPAELALGDTAPERPAPEPSYFRLYWNQCRMGGRQPEELAREVTLADARAALGLDDAVDEGARAAIADFEQREAVALPARLRALLASPRVVDAVLDCHCNSPELVPPGDDGWELMRDGRSRGVDGALAITILRPHQGDHCWVAAWDQGDEDARVYVSWQDDQEQLHFLLTAPTTAIFFWDLAQTGLAWYQETGHRGGKKVTRTDLGLALAR
ncbi:MAG TPA: hypothetical protein VL172_06765 [Kofleriaceae bacterium]|nr:hypothetical protein [Kofleriaceae bacterium]